MSGAAALQTPLARRLGIEFPIIQAPIGRVGGPELAAAVSNAGGLGMLGVTYLEPDDLRASIRATKSLTDRPFGVNMLLHWDQRERLAVCLTREYGWSPTSGRACRSSAITSRKHTAPTPS